MSNFNYHHINLQDPNPFTVRPIPTDMTTNDLLMHDPQMRIQSRTAIEDVGLKVASTFISPQHLNLGWKWR